MATTTKATRPPALTLREQLPEKARLQLFIYDRKKRHYRAAAGRHRVFILRSEAEAERFWAAVETLVDRPEQWQTE